MKKWVLVIVVCLLVAFAGSASAENPNQFEVTLNCEGETVHAMTPNIHSGGGHILGGGIATPFTHYIDFNGDGNFSADELVASIYHGHGFETTFCTWTWENDPFLHGMDIKFSPPE